MTTQEEAGVGCAWAFVVGGLLWVVILGGLALLVDAWWPA